MRFALLSVPVRLYTATRSAEPAIHQIERSTGARIQCRRVTEATGEEVPLDNIVKGFDMGARRSSHSSRQKSNAIASGVGIDCPADDGVERAPDFAGAHRTAT